MKKKYIFISVLVLAVSFLTYCFLPIVTYSPDSDKQPGRIFLTDRKGIVITDKAKENGYKKNISINIEAEFVKSLLKIEDKNYFSHFGIDLFSKFGALKNNILTGKVVSGGSTITEQYLKNKYFINSKRTYLQKSREAFIAFYNSLPYLPSIIGVGKNKKYIKQEILKQYLSNLYFGNNINGVGAALEVYFDKQNLEDLTQEEITLLISLIHNPGVKSLNEENFNNYFEMVKNKLGYNFERKIYSLNKKNNIDIFPFVTNNKSIHNGTITTIDSKLQQFAKDTLNKTLDELKQKNVTNGAIFAINPKTGEVLIYQGSRDFSSTQIEGQVNVLQSLRQPGSTLKPFLYLLALESGANPDDLVLDLESQYDSFQEGKTYISNNYSLNEYGLVRFKKALGNSLNNASVRLARELGLNRVYEFYKRYGFDLEQGPEYYGYSLVLGNPSIKLEDLVMSYISLLPDSKDINKFLLYDILSNPNNRDLSFGVNSILNTSIPQAVKTGTSSDFRDNVIISYHPDFVIGIWVGNNDNSSMIGVSGITGAGYIWHQIIEKAIELGYIHDEEITIPTGIEEGQYCLDIKCYRKELVYKKQGVKYNSRIADGFYSKQDLFENISIEEENRLKDFQIYIDK